MTVQTHKAKPVLKMFLRKFAKKHCLVHPFRGCGSICREARLPWQPSFLLEHIINQYKFSYGSQKEQYLIIFCDQDSHEMIALKNEADPSINKKVTI